MGTASCNKKRKQEAIPGINVIVPFISEPVHTLAMQYHCMEITKKVTEAVNPGQTLVDVSDQPVYALTKEVQWKYPELFQNYFPVMGALHIEQIFLKCHGQLIVGSGLADILQANKFSFLGTSTIVDVNDIKRARYCVQVALCSLYLILKDAVKQDKSCTLAPMEWLKSRINESEMCFYWFLVMNIQINILTFVRSIREGNFMLYVASIRSLIKWVFAFGHTHYARWLSVHLYDLVNLENRFPDVFGEMMKGHFSFLKTSREFSRIATDQVHEQNNKIIKGTGGPTQIMNKNDDSALIMWETCGPDIARILSEFEYSIGGNGTESGDNTKTA